MEIGFADREFCASGRLQITLTEFTCRSSNASLKRQIKIIQKLQATGETCELIRSPQQEVPGGG